MFRTNTFIDWHALMYEYVVLEYSVRIDIVEMHIAYSGHGFATMNAVWLYEVSL